MAIELYIVRQFLKITEGYTWIGTDLKGFIGVGHLLHAVIFKSRILRVKLGQK